MRIAITRHLDDEHFEILAASATHMATTDVYCEVEQFDMFGEQLMEFPRNLRDEVVFQSGSEDPHFAYLARLRAFVYDSAGHVALQVVMRSNFTPPYTAQAHFFIHSEAAGLNRLGDALRRWVRLSRNEHFVYDDKVEPNTGDNSR